MTWWLLRVHVRKRGHALPSPNSQILSFCPTKLHAPWPHFAKCSTLVPAALVLGYEAWCSTPCSRLVLGHLLELLVLEVLVLESKTANASHHSRCAMVPTCALMGYCIWGLLKFTHLTLSCFRLCLEKNEIFHSVLLVPFWYHSYDP